MCNDSFTFLLFIYLLSFDIKKIHIFHNPMLPNPKHLINYNQLQYLRRKFIKFIILVQFYTIRNAKMYKQLINTGF